jgi:hypothetical protein
MNQSNYVQREGNSTVQPTTFTTSVTDTIEDLEYALKATIVDQAVKLYKDKTAPNLQDYNDKFINLIQQLHKFYGTKELS